MSSHPNFNRNEFACLCCGLDDVSDDLLDALQSVRDILQSPMSISSGYRCPTHNAQIGSRKGSSHTKGLAADILVPSSTAGFSLMRAVMLSGKFQRIGFGQKGKSLVMHLDVDKDKVQNVLWGY